MAKNKYRSGFEKTIANLLQGARVRFKYEPYKIPYTFIANYNPDFVISTSTGDIIIECKGFLSATDRRKMKAVKNSNPDLDIRMWFMRDNYLTKAKSSKYSDWADKNGFPYHVGDTSPQHWFKGDKK